MLLHHGLEYGGRVGIDCGGWSARLVGETGRAPRLGGYYSRYDLELLCECEPVNYGLTPSSTCGVGWARMYCFFSSSFFFSPHRLLGVGTGAL